MPNFRYIFLILHLIVSLHVAADVLSGRVIDGESGEALPGASVMVKKGDGKMAKFASAKEDGLFTLDLAELPHGGRLEVSMMGYTKRSISLDSLPEPLTVEMYRGAVRLREVAVKAQAIRQQGDTLTFNVASFAQTRDRSIGDVLARMPGIEVSENGKIKYQGEGINKFYIEGRDLLGGRYGLATNNIQHEDVGAVEVMENHQPLQVLAGINYSDKAAINLRLKESSKARWMAWGKAAGGYGEGEVGLTGLGELFAMAVKPSYQNITTIKGANTGTRLSGQGLDLIDGLGSTSILSPYTSLTLPSTTTLGARRSLFNRSALVSTNNLVKTKRGELKANLDYRYDHTTARASDATTYYLSGGNRVIVEERDGRSQAQALDGKVTYEVNAPTTFINYTLQPRAEWSSTRLSTTGSVNGNYRLEEPTVALGNSLKVIRRFNGKHLITFTASNSLQSLPQRFHIENEDGLVDQDITQRASLTNAGAAYAFALGPVSVGMEGGLRSFQRFMSSTLKSSPVPMYPGIDNVINTGYNTLHVTPTLGYWAGRVNLSLKLPVSVARYTFDKAMANRSEGYFSPSLSADWAPNNRLQLRARASAGRSPMNLSMVYTGFIITDPRTIHRGVDEFYNSSSRVLSGSLAYKLPRRGLFADASLVKAWNSVPYTLSQQLSGNTVYYSYSPAKSNSNSLVATCSVSKTIDFISGVAAIRGSWINNGNTLLSESNAVHSVNSSWNATASLSGTVSQLVGWDCSATMGASRLAMNGSHTPWLSTLTSDVNLTITPTDRLEWHLGASHHLNEIAPEQLKQMILFDTRLVYRLNKRIELGASLTNILDARRYEYIIYNELTSYRSSRSLRGREFLFTITFKQ